MDVRGIYRFFDSLNKHTSFQWNVCQTILIDGGFCFTGAAQIKRRYANRMVLIKMHIHTRHWSW